MKTDVKKNSGNVFIWAIGAVCFVVISVGVICTAHFAVTRVAANSQSELTYMVNEAVNTYANAAMSDKLAQSEASALRAEDAADRAEEALSKIESVSISDDLSPESFSYDKSRVDEKNIVFLDDGTVVYNIQRGDTLCYISEIFYVSIDELVKENHIIDSHWIYTDSSIRIPTEKQLFSMD